MEMLKTLAVILVVAPMIFTTGAVAQTQTEDRQADDKQTDERVVEGQVQSIDVSGTAITLTDGTKLLTPAGRSGRAISVSVVSQSLGCVGRCLAGMNGSTASIA